MAAPPQATNNAPVSDNRCLVPPEEQFWVRYFAHHEFPFSTVASICLYALVGVLLWVAFKFLLPLLSDSGEPIPVEPIAMAGGGGDPNGTGNLPGKEYPPEDTGKPDTEENLPPDLKPDPKERLDTIAKNVTEKVEIEVPPEDTEATRYVEAKTQPSVSLSKVGEKARSQLMQPLRAARGNGGTGTDGGKDRGRDKGTGDGQGEGKMLNERQKRVLRWTMMFDTRNGDDYRVQLIALEAILGIPDGNGGYRVVRDLRTKPAKLEVEDLKNIKRIFWVDDRPGSVQPLAQALGIPVPQHVVAFFPEKLEKDLLRKELNFRHKKEHEILETRFRVVRRGNTFEPMVVDQR